MSQNKLDVHENACHILIGRFIIDPDYGPGYEVGLVARGLTAITGKRLIEKGINLIVPGQQLYLPALMLDFNETFKKETSQKKTLLPSVQVILSQVFSALS